MNTICDIYFESFSISVDTCENNPEQSYTQKIMKQVRSSFCFYFVRIANDKLFKPITNTTYGDEDVGEIFVGKSHL